MDSAPVIASRSFPNRPSLGESRPANDPGNLGLRMAPSTGTVENNIDARKARSDVGSGSLRQRRRKRLVDKSRNAAARASPPTTQQPPQQHSLRTVSEHKSMDHSRLDKDTTLSLSADATAESTILSAETSETSPDNIRVRRMPLTNNDLHAAENDALPQSILATTQTFPPTDQHPVQTPTPRRLTSSSKDSARALAASEALPSANILPRRQRQRSQSLWDETRRKERTQQRSKKKIPPLLSQSPSFGDSRRSISPLKRFSKPQNKSFDEAKRPSKPKPKALVSRPRPKLKRHSTAPTSPTKQTNVVDDVLMDRAFIIRQNLMNFEMQELAAEAEKAAESGLERFVGSTSKFGVEETPPYKPKFVDDGDFVMNSGDGLVMTPSRKKSFVDTLTHPMDYTPSYFSRKKIPVTSLRNFSEIVPNFVDMHQNIRRHLTREGVDVNTLPELHSRRSLIKNDTDDTEKEDGEDAISQAPSVAASHTESISSFSSYAVASLASLKEIIEYVNRPRSPTDSNARTSSSMSNVSHSNPVPKDIEHSSPPRRRTVDFMDDKKKGMNGSLPHSATHFRPAVDSVDSDSDDSSVEFYGRKSPIDLNLSASSNLSEKMGMNQWKSSLAPSRSNVSAGDRKRRIGTSASVSFETEKANYQALLDKMHHHTSPSVSFDVDTNSCAPSLTNMDIDILSSSPTSSTNKSTPMANFLSKIGFSRSASTSGDHRSKALDEDNEHFVANFFYTNQASNIADPSRAPTLKLDINPERDRDPYCLSGCGPNNLLSACDTATKYADLVFDWFNVGGNQQRKPNVILDPKASEQTLHPKWMKTWQTNESENFNGQRLFTPPKLSVKHTAPHDDDIFCSPDSAKLGNECDGALACPVDRESVTCPEIQNKIGCSPD